MTLYVEKLCVQQKGIIFLRPHFRDIVYEHLFTDCSLRRILLEHINKYSECSLMVHRSSLNRDFLDTSDEYIPLYVKSLDYHEGRDKLFLTFPLHERVEIHFHELLSRFIPMDKEFTRGFLGCSFSIDGIHNNFIDFIDMFVERFTTLTYELAKIREYTMSTSIKRVPEVLYAEFLKGQCMLEIAPRGAYMFYVTCWSNDRIVVFLQHKERKIWTHSEDILFFSKLSHYISSVANACWELHK